MPQQLGSKDLIAVPVEVVRHYENKQYKKEFVLRTLCGKLAKKWYEHYSRLTSLRYG